MFTSFWETASNALTSMSSTAPRPGLHPIPGTIPLTIEAAICPPLLYYLALLFLPPAPPPAIDTKAVKILRNLTALVAGVLFFRLPLAYHVPQSIGLTYQLGLVGLYGGCRVIDAFFVSAIMFDHVPRRVYYEHTARVESESTDDETKEWSDGGQRDPFSNKGHHQSTKGSTSVRKRMTNGNDASNSSQSLLSKTLSNERESEPNQNGTADANPRNRRKSMLGPYFLVSRALAGPDPIPVYECARSEDGWPHSFTNRASWALELELSMRGIGFTWTTADVRHTRKTWLPTVGNRLHSIAVHVLPVLVVSGAIIRQIYTTYLAQEPSLFDPKTIIIPSPSSTPFSPPTTKTLEVFDANLTLPLQLLLTTCLGAFLMSAFSFAHSLFAILLSPLAPSPLAFFPPLYTTRVWDLTSVRKFWSFGWHRLFARLFLVYGVWPGEWAERKIRRLFSSSSSSPSHRQSNSTPPKSSSLKSPASSRSLPPADIGKVLGGFLSSAFVHSFSVRGALGGDWLAASGEAKFFALNGLAVVFEGAVQRLTKKIRRKFKWRETMWYDAWIGRVWWITVLIWTGRNFARGWVKSGLVREMAFM